MKNLGPAQRVEYENAKNKIKNMTEENGITIFDKKSLTTKVYLLFTKEEKKIFEECARTVAEYEGLAIDIQKGKKNVPVKSMDYVV